MEGRLPGARGPWSPTGGWKPPLRQTTVGSVNAEMHRLPGARGDRSPAGGWKPPLRQPTEGSVNAEMLPSAAVTSDIYPTLLEIAGIKVDHQPVIDGISLWPLLDPGTPERIWRHLSCREN